MVLPVGYRVPHPLVFDVHIKVETMDHSTTPLKVFETALEDLSLEVDILTTKFDVSDLGVQPRSAIILIFVCHYH